jgi:hypothetical protein
VRAPYDREQPLELKQILVRARIRDRDGKVVQRNRHIFALTPRQVNFEPASGPHIERTGLSSPSTLGFKERFVQP